MAQVAQDTRSEPVSTEPLAIASCDSHIGPLMSQLRELCPKDLLDDFDAYETAFAKWRQEMMEGQISFFGGTDNKSPEAVADGQRFASMYMRAQRTEGHHDMAARERDMDRDGVATDVIYHGSVNGQPIPFAPGGEDFFFTPTEGDLDLAAKGLHIYNEWLAEACSASPERHLGLAHVPTWNIEASVREAEWAAEYGLGGVNLPVPRPGILPGPLGLPGAPDLQGVQRALEVSTGAPKAHGNQRRIADLHLVADDVDWSFGSGPDVTGPGEALPMVMWGRPAALEDLDGEGVATLRSRT